MLGRLREEFYSTPCSTRVYGAHHYTCLLTCSIFLLEVGNLFVVCVRFRCFGSHSLRVHAFCSGDFVSGCVMQYIVNYLSLVPSNSENKTDAFKFWSLERKIIKGQLPT